MIPIYYKSSEGEIVNLIETPYMMLTDTDLLNSEWEPTTTGENFPRITRLDKKLVSPKFKIRVTGSTKNEMLNNLEHLESVFDRDCFLNQMGRLYIGEFYRECFITGITHGKVFEKTHTVAEFVATSNDGYWVNNKQISFSGSGAMVGEIADRVLVNTNFKNEDVVVAPLADHKAHITWNGTLYTSNEYWFKLDMGSVIDIESISGLKLKSTATPIENLKVQTSNGETVDDARTQSVTTDEESEAIFVDSFSQITIDAYGESGWESARLQVRGYFNSERNMYVTYNDVMVGDTIDCTDFVYISFMIIYAPNYSTTVEYTVNEEQWTTIETITVPINSESEIELSNLTCRYVRLKNNFFGTGFNEDLSIVSAEEVTPRNLLKLGYQLENVSEERTDIPDDVYVFWSINNTSLDGFVYFDDTNIELKSIVTGSAIEVTGTLQGFANNEWVDIADIEQNMDETYNEHYDRLRINLTNDSEFDLSNFTIEVTTDAKVYNESYAPSDAIIKIKGAWSNPHINIGGTLYGANIELQENHILEINTKKKTLRDYSDSDTYENVYVSKLDGTFEQIESGENEVDWTGNAEEIEITLEQARSIPKWN